MKKFIIITIIFIFIFIGFGFFWYKYRPFIICPEGYNKVIRNFPGKTKFCEDENGNLSGIYYDRNNFGEVRINIYNDYNELINHKYYDKNGHLYEECYPENGLTKCTSYYDGNFNLFKGIKNFFNGIWSRYSTGPIERIEYEDEDKYYINQGPYYLYHKNGIIELSGNYNNGLQVGLRTHYDENGNIVYETHYDENGNFIKSGYYE